MTVADIAPSSAQTTVEPQAPSENTTTKVVGPRRHRRVVRRPATSSAVSRNVGPSSTVNGNMSNVAGGRAGVPEVPGAPSAGAVGGGGAQ